MKYAYLSMNYKVLLIFQKQKLGEEIANLQ